MGAKAASEGAPGVEKGEAAEEAGACDASARAPACEGRSLELDLKGDDKNVSDEDEAPLPLLKSPMVRWSPLLVHCCRPGSTCQQLPKADMPKEAAPAHSHSADHEGALHHW